MFTELFPLFVEATIIIVVTGIVLMYITEMAFIEDSISVRKIIKKIRMLSPKYKAQERLEDTYELLYNARNKIKDQKKKSKKNKKNLKEIEKSMKILSDMISCKGDLSKLHSLSTTPNMEPPNTLTADEKEFLHE